MKKADKILVLGIDGMDSSFKPLSHGARIYAQFKNFN